MMAHAIHVLSTPTHHTTMPKRASPAMVVLLLTQQGPRITGTVVGSYKFKLFDHFELCSTDVIYAK